MLHELTINAVKHGALSVSTGRVTVSIAVNQRSGGLIVDWNETGGPAVDRPPRRRGSLTP